MSSFEDTLRAVRGKDGIIECLKAGNDAPLDLVLDAARKEIEVLKWRLAIYEKAVRPNQG